MAGDFNEVLYSWERRETSGGNRRFKECLEQCELKDAGFKGTKYTWERGLCHERLDKGITNKLSWENSGTTRWCTCQDFYQAITPSSLWQKTRMIKGIKKKRFTYQAAWGTHPNWKTFLDNV